ncbi:MAG TPA: hypothetical protein VEU30_08090, partial [Thermoanaerobaculia bacterium]|nr:hypothetical protein [Thermoanaerobaculia bacterium]
MITLSRLSLSVSGSPSADEHPAEKEPVHVKTLCSLATLALATLFASAQEPEGRTLVSRPGVLVVTTENGVRRSSDEGATFDLIHGLDLYDAIVAADAYADTILLGNSAGEVIEVRGDLALRERVCDGPVSRVVYAIGGPAAFVECDGIVFVREDDVAQWRPFRARTEERIRAIVADPFDGGALFVGTDNGTYRWTAAESVRVAGPADELRVVDFPTHTAIVTAHGTEVTELAATTCSYAIDYYGGRRGGVLPTHNISHLPSSFTFAVRASAPSCKWYLDVKGAPDWLHFAVSGNGLGRKQIGFTGSVSIDGAAQRNGGYARWTDFKVLFGSSVLKSHVSQWHRTSLCMHKPVSDDPTQTATLFSEQELLVLKRYWGDPAVKSPRVIFKLKDSSGCPADGLLYGVTPAAAGTTIIT